MSFVAAKQPVVSDSPEQVAWATLRGIKEGHNLGDKAIESAKLREIHDAGNGPLIARFEQEVDGVPVFLRTLSIAMDRNLSPTLASGQLAGQLRKVSERFQLDESAAVANDRAAEVLVAAEISVVAVEILGAATSAVEAGISAAVTSAVVEVA